MNRAYKPFQITPGLDPKRREMSLSSLIAPHLPYLRRFSRSLTGSQASGDAYVASLLEAWIEDPSSLENAEDPKIHAFSALCQIWSSLSINQKRENGGDGWENTVHDRLSVLPPLNRQTFLLATVEGFNTADVAKILNKSESQVKKLLYEARTQIAEMMSTDILIIEDEPLIALDLEDIVTSLGHRVTGVARTHKEALKLAASKKPGLVLSDIQLADGSSGLDAVADILKSFSVPVIFITAFPERLLTGERPEPAFLITKPFIPDMVKGMIAQALFFNMKSRSAAQSQEKEYNT